MVRNSGNEYERRHEGEISRRRLLSYLVGGGALAAGVYFGVPKLLESSPEMLRAIEHSCNEVMRQNNDPNAVENIEERIKKLKRRLEERLERAHPITSFGELNDIRKNLDWDYRLESDIECPKGHNWEPIGIPEKPFIGSLNGQGYTIHGLRAEWPDRDYVGMFGYVKSNSKSISAIGNLNLKKSVVIGRSYVGGLVGLNLGGFVFNGEIDTNVTGFLQNIGGVIGFHCGEGIVLEFRSNGEVKGDEIVGGLLGYNNEGYVGCSPNNSVRHDTNRHFGSLMGINYSPISWRDDFSERIIGSPGTIGWDRNKK
jgi:hypothetical protein